MNVEKIVKIGKFVGLGLTVIGGLVSGLANIKGNELSVAETTKKLFDQQNTNN
jgi:hypothetical protein